jgi:hypothetical protein
VVVVVWVVQSCGPVFVPGLRNCRSRGACAAAWCVWVERLGGAVQHAWPSGRLGLEIRVGSWLGMGRPFMLTMCVMVSHGDASRVAWGVFCCCWLCSVLERGWLSPLLVRFVWVVAVNVAMVWTWWGVLERVRVLSSVACRGESEVFVLVPCYSCCSWKRCGMSALCLNFGVATFAGFRRVSKVC